MWLLPKSCRTHTRRCAHTKRNGKQHVAAHTRDGTAMVTRAVVVVVITCCGRTHGRRNVREIRSWLHSPSGDIIIVYGFDRTTLGFAIVFDITERSWNVKTLRCDARTCEQENRRSSGVVAAYLFYSLRYYIIIVIIIINIVVIYVTIKTYEITMRFRPGSLGRTREWRFIHVRTGVCVCVCLWNHYWLLYDVIIHDVFVGGTNVPFWNIHYAFHSILLRYTECFFLSVLIRFSELCNA